MRKRAKSPHPLRVLRNQWSRTQIQWGELLGVHPQTVSNWETGRARPLALPAEFLRVLADVLPEARSTWVAANLRPNEGNRTRTAFWRAVFAMPYPVVIPL